MYSLSWNTFAVVPTTVTGVPQVNPPSVDFVTAITFPGAPVRLNARQLWYTVPSASNATAGAPAARVAGGGGPATTIPDTGTGPWRTAWKIGSRTGDGGMGGRAGTDAGAGCAGGGAGADAEGLPPGASGGGR